MKIVQGESKALALVNLDFINTRLRTECKPSSKDAWLGFVVFRKRSEAG